MNNTFLFVLCIGTGTGLRITTLDPLQHAQVITQPKQAPQELADFVGGGDSTKIGLVSFHNVLTYCAPRPDAKILEVGVGFGRNARYFVTYLDGASGGEYHGFDITEPLIDWAKQNLETQYPHAHFQHVDIFNEFYSNADDGKWRGNKSLAGAATFTFPYDSNYFDVVHAPSVWTHLKTDEAVNYLKETFRVLKPGGKALLNFFLEDELTEEKLLKKGCGTINEQINSEPGVRWHSSPDLASVVFNEKWLASTVNSIGFNLVTTTKGIWCGQNRAIGLEDFQDKILIAK